MNDKDAARQAFRDQQLQDTEGGAPCPISFIAGFVDGCRHKDKEYSNLMDAMTQTSQNNAKLLEENAKLKKFVSALGYDELLVLLLCH